MKNLIAICIAIFCIQTINAQNVSTAKDRAALFDYIIEKTIIRESLSPIKEEILQVDVINDMKQLRDEVISADTDEKLYYALQKLSAARKDRHLTISQIENGLVLPAIDQGTAPIRFHPDFSDKDNYFCFVSDLGEEVQKYTKGKTPAIGDKLIKINNRPFLEYFNAAKVYWRYSNIENLWMRLVYGLSDKSIILPPSFYQDELQLTLEKKTGEIYEISLPYLDDVEWKYGRVNNDYPGYKLETTKETFHLYTPTDPTNKTLLLWWYGFRGDLHEAIDQLIDFADKNNMLDYDIIIDATDSRGGSQGAYALSRLTSQAFKTTGGNIKLSDITDDFIADYTERYVARQAVMDGSGREAEDDGTWVMDWLHGPVLKGLAAGQAYSNNTPFKCAHLPHYSDWMMAPAEKHFTGKLAVMFGPWGGSHLSQFAAMIIDNDLGYTIGMPDGGYSNTWEWEENLVFPISGKPVVEFMWSIGHTIRPNGEILEGNPPQVDEYIPVTRENYLNYKKMLLKKATEKLKSNEN